MGYNEKTEKVFFKKIPLLLFCVVSGAIFERVLTVESCKLYKNKYMISSK